MSNVIPLASSVEALVWANIIAVSEKLADDLRDQQTPAQAAFVNDLREIRTLSLATFLDRDLPFPRLLSWFNRHRSEAAAAEVRRLVAMWRARIEVSPVPLEVA